MVFGGRVRVGKENENCSLGEYKIRAYGDRNHIVFGKGVTFGGGRITAVESTKIKIGEDSMISYDVDIMRGFENRKGDYLV